jgi:hypothetical protein
MHPTFELSGVWYGVAQLALWTSVGEYDPAESTLPSGVQRALLLFRSTEKKTRDMDCKFH